MIRVSYETAYALDPLHTHEYGSVHYYIENFNILQMSLHLPGTGSYVDQTHFQNIVKMGNEPILRRMGMVFS